MGRTFIHLWHKNRKPTWGQYIPWMSFCWHCRAVQSFPSWLNEASQVAVWSKMSFLIKSCEVTSFRMKIFFLKKGIIFARPKQHWIAYRTPVHVDPCNLRWKKKKIPTKKNKKLSVVCDCLISLWWVVWWLQPVWLKDGQWGESGLYLLPYLFLCAQN